MVPARGVRRDGELLDDLVRERPMENRRPARILPWLQRKKRRVGFVQLKPMYSACRSSRESQRTRGRAKARSGRPLIPEVVH